MVYRTDPSAHRSDGQIYTAYNIWYELPERIYCINYRRGQIIRVGSPVSSVRFITRMFRKYPAVRFTLVGRRECFDVYFNDGYHPGMSLTQFRDRLLSVVPFEELTRGLTHHELACVRRGEVAPGMSRRAVLLARGYPPEHRTPSLESSTWIYWDSRFHATEVHFDARGQTTAPPPGLAHRVV